MEEISGCEELNINNQNPTEYDFGNKQEQVIHLIKREFQNEITKRQDEIHLIQKRLLKAKKSLHLLKYVVIKSFYDNKDLNITNKDELMIQSSSSIGIQRSVGIQNRIHPAVKKLLGKKPVNFNLPSIRSREKAQSILSNNRIEEHNIKIEDINADYIDFASNANNQLVTIKECFESNENIPRGNQKKIKHEIIVGNISKYAPSSNAQDASSHKWMIYVRGPRDNPDISHIVKKVRFFLHPSYQPNDVIEIDEPPFHLSRRGWGEFPVRVQIHFQYSFNKPIDIIHNLKLDQTRSGRQTLGSETLLNVWLYNNTYNSEEETEVFQTVKRIKQEVSEVESTQVQHFNSEPSCSKNFRENEINIIHNETGFQVIKNETTNNSEFAPNLESNNALAFDFQYRFKIEDDSDDGENCADASVARDPNEIYDDDKTFLFDHCYTDEIIHDNFLRNTQKYAISIPLHRFKSTRQIVYFLFKSLPLVTPLALNLTYNCYYPYAAVTLREFASWNIGKQRCCEWYRAKEIKELLILHNVPDHKLWSIKFILMFGRANAFTPFANYQIFQTKKEAAKTIPNQKSELKVCSTFSEYIPISQLMENKSLHDVNHENTSIVDVENEIYEENVPVKSKTSKIERISSETDKKLNPICTYIRDCTEDMAITLEDEEIVPNVLHNTAERILLQAVTCLAEELIRSAWANKVITNKGRNLDHEIDRNDVYRVLLEREEFDIFTNDGLGKNVEI